MRLRLLHLSILFSILVQALTWAVPHAFGAGERPSKTLILYSSIGSGHLTAAKGIEAKILERSPKSKVILKDIRDFMNRHHEYWDERIFWFIVKNYPRIFTSLYNQVVQEGKTVSEYTHLDQSYRLDELYEFIEKEGPDSIIATHYGSAIALGTLRSEGKVLSRRLGWLHTDYVVQHLPRISSSIDRSFLPHVELEKIWVEKGGVDPEKVTTTGMPLNPKLFAPVDAEAVFKKNQLDPTVSTITLASGAEGVGDFPAIVKSLSESIPGNLQIVAVCAKNEENYAALGQMLMNLRQGVKLVVKGFIPNDDLLDLIKISNLYITKAGGLSPTEAFAIGRPTLIMDIYGGHESENALFFEKLGLAEVNREPERLGEQAKGILVDLEKQERMAKAQEEFRSHLDLEDVVNFALTEDRPSFSEKDLGLQNGTPVGLSDEALYKLEKDSPADVELLFSQSVSPDPQFKSKEANSFGHISIRIKNFVYTVNQNASRDEDFLIKMPLKDYLYGVESPAEKAEIGSHYGLSYSRETLGLRIGGLSEARVKEMEEEIGKISSEWKSGELQYGAICNNCADITQRVLKSGELNQGPRTVFGIVLPREVFEAQLRALDKNPNLTGELVAYSKVKGTRNFYRYSRFPISPYSPIDLVRGAISERIAQKTPKAIAFRVTKRIAHYPEDPDLRYENISGTSVTEETKAERKNFTNLSGRLRNLRREEARLEADFAKLKLMGMSSHDVITKISSGLSSTLPEEPSKRNSAELAQLETKTGPPSFAAEVNQEYSRFQNRYDAYQRERILWVINFFMQSTRSLKAELDRRLNLDQKEELRKLYVILEKHYLEYVTYERLYNQPKDVKRIDAFRAFMSQEVKLLTYVDKVFSQKGFLGQIKTGASELWQSWLRLKKLLPVLPKIGSVMYDLRFNKNTAPNETPLVESINASFMKLGDQLGIEVKVVGKENIPANLPAKTLNIFMIQHSHPQLDNIALAHMDLEPYAIYGAADTFAPKIFADMMDANDSFIVVGRGSDKPIEKTVDILEKDKVQNLVIYPEGSVSLGMFDVRAPREKFVAGLLNKLKAEGYQFNLIPVTMPQNFRLNNDWMTSKDPKDRKLLAKIGKPIDSQFVNSVLGTDQEQLINRLIRMDQFESLAKDSPYPFLGTPKMDEILEMLQESMGWNRCDQHLEKISAVASSVPTKK